MTTENSLSSQQKFNMPKFRDTIPLAHASHLRNSYYYDLNRPKSPDLPYTNYNHFDLDKMTDDECKTEFRFHKPIPWHF